MKEKDAVAQAKEQARKAREKVEKLSTEGSALFKLGSEAAESTTTYLREVNESEVPKDVGQPHLMRLPLHAQESTWAQHAKVQLALSGYGGEYRSLKTTQVEGKGQRLLQPKEGKEETDIMFSQVASLLELDKAAATVKSPASTIIESTMLFGLEPGREFCSFSPQALACVKVLVIGEIAFMTCSAKSLMSAWETLKFGPINAETLEEKVLALSVEDVGKLKGAGCPMYAGRLKAAGSLFIPAGWVVLERAMPKAQLIYGVRKSYVIKKPAAHADYAAAISLMQVSGSKKVEKYKIVLETMKDPS